MFIKPTNSNIKVPDPIRKDFLPGEGREVTSDPYWRRRLAAGDIVEASTVGEAGAASGSKKSSKGD